MTPLRSKHGRPDDDVDRLVDEAAALLLKLKAAPRDAGVLAEAAAWQARSARHARAWRAAERVWSLAGEIGRDAPVFSPVRRRRWRSTGMAAGVFAAAACLVLFVQPALESWRADFRTETGEIKTVTLSDGSRVDLDTTTAITVDDAGAERRVVLLKGRAFFDVAKDTARPFSVVAGDVAVTVTGTRFEVGMSPDAVDVNLAEGAVVAAYAEGAARTRAVLSPGDHLHVGQTVHEARVSRAPVATMAAWRLGKLSIDGATVSDIVEQLRPYYPGTIVVTDDSLGRQFVTGVFDIRDPAGALSAIVEPHAGKVRRITPWLLLVSAS